MVPHVTGAVPSRGGPRTARRYSLSGQLWHSYYDVVAALARDTAQLEGCVTTSAMSARQQQHSLANVFG